MMPVLLRFLLLPVLCLLALQSLRAAEVAGLYEARVPVANQSAGDRARAIDAGFRQVLVKVSGQRSVLAAPAIQAALGKGESLLGSYRYESASGQSEASGQGILFIRLSFDPAGVRATLNRAGAPVWGASRPPLYLWLVREGAQGGTLFSLGTPQADVLLDVAAQRGLPTVLPPPGTPADNDAPVNGVPTLIREAATRAGAKLVLAASLGGSGSGVRASGVLSVDGAVERLETVAKDEVAAIRELVADAADRLGARYAIVARQDQMLTVRLRVTGVRSLAMHAGLERWLGSLPLVRDLIVEEILHETAGEQIEYGLTLAGATDRLLQAMAADGRFASVGTPIVEGSMMTITAALADTPAP